MELRIRDGVFEVVNKNDSKKKLTHPASIVDYIYDVSTVLKAVYNKVNNTFCI